MQKHYNHVPFILSKVVFLKFFIIFLFFNTTLIISQVTNTAPVVNAGVNQSITLPNQAALTGTATDDGLPGGSITVSWKQISGLAGVVFSNPNSLTTTAAFPSAATFNFELTVSDGELTSRDTVQIRTFSASGTNQSPTLSAGPDKEITLPTNSVQLDGFANDDGLPVPPAGLNITWVQLSGTAGVTFTNAKTPVTTATFPAAGTYLLRLRASDGAIVKLDTVKVTVNPATVTNTAPVVNAGTDQTITLPTNSITLSGTATDDGLPNPPAALTNTWTQISGPSGVTFGSSSSLSTTATLPSSGTYQLQLSVSDGSLISQDTIVINRTSVPVVNAGINQQIIMPLDSVQLSGTANDDTLPNPPAAMTFLWSKFSGPGTVTFRTGNQLQTIAKFNLSGTYVLRLTASDGLLQGTDTVIVVVKPTASIPASLKTVQVPGPDKSPGFDFTQFIVNNDAAVKLGKALFWDAQVGSDGIQACANCHFAAGADNRSKNQVHPGSTTSFNFSKAPNMQLTISQFPLSQNKADDDVIGSQGVFNTQFTDIVLGNDVESGTVVPDGVFNVSGVNVRRVTGRNAPSVINAVYNYRNFWDGRANHFFNGVTPFGMRDQNAKVFKIVGGTVAAVSIAIPLSSLASQAVGPPLNSNEMSFSGKAFAKLGKKLLSLKPLAKQLVSPTDSKFGLLSRSPLMGLDTSVTYVSLIKAAFNSQWWNSDNVITFVNGQPVISGPKGSPLTTDEFTVMEANFSLFWGLAIQAYEQTLVSDDSKFDKFREGTATLTAQEQQGLNLFMGKGRCINCHSGPRVHRCFCISV